MEAMLDSDDGTYVSQQEGGGVRWEGMLAVRDALDKRDGYPMSRMWHQGDTGFVRGRKMWCSWAGYLSESPPTSSGRLSAE